MAKNWPVWKTDLCEELSGEELSGHEPICYYYFSVSFTFFAINFYKSICIVNDTEIGKNVYSLTQMSYDIATVMLHCTFDGKNCEKYISYKSTTAKSHLQ